MCEHISGFRSISISQVILVQLLSLVMLDRCRWWLSRYSSWQKHAKHMWKVQCPNFSWNISKSWRQSVIGNRSVNYMSQLRILFHSITDTRENPNTQRLPKIENKYKVVSLYRPWVRKKEFTRRPKNHKNHKINL